MIYAFGWSERPTGYNDMTRSITLTASTAISRENSTPPTTSPDTNNTDDNDR